MKSLSFTNIGKLCFSREFLTLQIFLFFYNTIQIKFSRKFPNLQYSIFSKEDEKSIKIKGEVAVKSFPIYILTDFKNATLGYQL